MQNLKPLLKGFIKWSHFKFKFLTPRMAQTRKRCVQSILICLAKSVTILIPETFIQTCSSACLYAVPHHISLQWKYCKIINLKAI